MNENNEISVINFLDKHAIVKNGELKKMSHRRLQDSFPEIDEFSLKTWSLEWHKARQAMLSLKF